MESSKFPDTRGTVEEIAEGKATADAEVENGGRLDLIASRGGASEVMDVESSFELSVEVMILDEGNRVTDGASERVNEIAEEPFREARSSRDPRGLTLVVVASLTGIWSTEMGSCTVDVVVD